MVDAKGNLPVVFILNIQIIVLNSVVFINVCILHDIGATTAITPVKVCSFRLSFGYRKWVGLPPENIIQTSEAKFDRKKAEVSW